MLRKLLLTLIVLISFFGLLGSDMFAAEDPDFVGPPAPAATRPTGPDNLGSTDFTLNVTNLSPTGSGGHKLEIGLNPKDNINELLHAIVYLLLIIIPSLAVLFIVVGGIKIILAGGDSSKVGQGKTIITFNIIAVVISLLSYSIIQLTVWILGG